MKRITGDNHFQMKLLAMKFIDFIKKHRRIVFYIVTIALVAPEVTVYFNHSSRGADIYGYLDAGHDALNVDDLYRNSAPGKNNTWPPFFSLFISPLALSEDLIGIPLTKEIWYFFNFFALIGSIQILSIIVNGKKPSFFKASQFDFTSDLIFVPVLLVLPALVSTFFMLQINAFILFLISCGFLLHIRRKYLLAGLLFGIAGAIKAYPGLFVIYFLFRKQWKTAGFTVFWGTILTLSPIILYGFEGYINLMKEWLTISFSKPFIVGYTTFNNHSLYAFWERLLAHQLHLTEPASNVIKYVNLLSIVIIFGTVIIKILKHPYREDTTLRSLEFSIICIMMILFPPIAWGHYWLLLLPATTITYTCIRQRPDTFNPTIKTLFIIGILLIQIPYVFSKSVIQTFMKSYSCYTLAALISIIILLHLHSALNNEYKAGNLQTTK